MDVIKPDIRWMIRRDLPEVLDIENAVFEFPWNEAEYIRCLRQRNCIGMVADWDEIVVGYVIYELHKAHIHIVNIATSPDLPRHKIGSAIIDKLTNKLSYQRREKISLEVRETNLAAQLFFKQAGFEWVSTLKDFYKDTEEDGYAMEYHYAREDKSYTPTNRISRLVG